MGSFLLSICIPTWNRSSYLEGLLQTIYSDIANDNDFQIVIGDNNSDLSTYKAVGAFFEKLNIKYIRQDRNIGFGKNLISTINQADGEYCIIIGDDDIFRPGWLKSIKSLTHNFQPDILISDRYVCDIDLNVQFSEQCGPKVDIPTLFNCSDSEILLTYFENTLSTSGFGFISNIIVKHSSWLKSVNAPYVSGHLYTHTIKILDILHNLGGKLLRVPVESVFARAGNDRLGELISGDENEFSKLMMQFEGFLSAAEFVLFDVPYKKAAFLTPLKRIFSPNFKAAFLNMAPTSNQRQAAENFIFQLDRALGSTNVQS